MVRRSPPHGTGCTLAGGPYGDELELGLLDEADRMSLGDRAEERFAPKDVLPQDMPRLSSALR